MINPYSFLKNLIHSRYVSNLLILLIFLIVAAASNFGFYSKWHIHEVENPRYSVQMQLDGTAHKPFIYRQLNPIIAKHLDQYLSPELKSKLVQIIDIKEQSFSYKAVYFLSFLGAFLSLITLRLILVDQGVSNSATLLAPIIFLLWFPYLQTNGGYHYDRTELFFLSLAVLSAYRFNLFLLVLVVVLGTLNKESFFFFIPTLYPFLKEKLNVKRAVLITFFLLLVAGLINIYFKLKYGDNLGVVAENHFIENIYSIFNLSGYFRAEMTYGLIGPSLNNFLTILFILIIVLKNWANLSPIIKQHAKIAAAINFPLYLALGVIGEFRGLGFLFVTFVILLGLNFTNTTKNQLSK